MDQTNGHTILQVEDHHQQIPMGSGIWPNYHLLQMPSSSTNIALSSSSGSLSDILGIHMEMEKEVVVVEEEEVVVEEEEEELGAMKEMMYKIAAMQPVDIDPASIRKPKRRNVRISDDPQSVAARHRRERISEKIRILQRLVPGGTKMDTASMLDEAIRYVKFLKRQIRLLQSTSQTQCIPPLPPITTIPSSSSSSCDWPFTPNLLLSSVDMSAGVGFGIGGHSQPCDASSTL